MPWKTALKRGLIAAGGWVPAGLGFETERGSCQEMTFFELTLSARPFTAPM